MQLSTHDTIKALLWGCMINKWKNLHPSLLVQGAKGEMWGYWKSLFLSVTDDHAPFAKVTVRQESLSWITVEVRRLMRTIL